MKKLTLKESEVCNVSFVHVNGQPATLRIMMNPLTGDWLQTWTQTWTSGDTEQAYYSDKNEATKIVRNVVKRSAEQGLTCEVSFSPCVTA